MGATIGLHHFRARWMSPKSGRFLGRDPIGFVGSKWALYEFVRARALGRTDPTGLKCCLLTWNTRIDAYGSHSALSCDGGLYVSVYPGGTSETDPTHPNNPPHYQPSEVCIEGLDEDAIRKKWLEIKDTKWTELSNCSWFTAVLLQEGIKGGKSDCMSVPCGRCKDRVCLDSCSNRLGTFLNYPIATELYLKCLISKNGNPWTGHCASRGRSGVLIVGSR